MVASASHNGVLLLQDERFAGKQPLSFAGHAMVPLLLGLVIALLAILIMAPGVFSNPSLVFGLFLTVIFIVSAVLFVRSVFNPGSVVEATFDRRSATATFTRYGTFASGTIAVPFKSISKVYIETHHDEDGYRSFLPFVELASGELLQLPEGTTQGQIEAIRAILAR